MISKELIHKLVSEALTEEFFIVDVIVRTGNNIEILLDGDSGITIQKCVDVSRSVESKLDRDVEDYELSVSSAGLGRPFKVYRQFSKNIGQMVEVIRKEEKPVSGVLKTVDQEGFELEYTVKEKVEATKKKIEVVKLHRFLFIDEVEVRNIITFN